MATPWEMCLKIDIWAFVEEHSLTVDRRTHAYREGIMTRQGLSGLVQTASSAILACGGFEDTFSFLGYIKRWPWKGNNVPGAVLILLFSYSLHPPWVGLKHGKSFPLVWATDFDRVWRKDPLQLPHPKWLQPETSSHIETHTKISWSASLSWCTERTCWDYQLLQVHGHKNPCVTRSQLFWTCFCCVFITWDPNQANLKWSFTGEI